MERWKNRRKAAACALAVMVLLSACGGGRGVFRAGGRAASEYGQDEAVSSPAFAKGAGYENSYSDSYADEDDWEDEEPEEAYGEAYAGEALATGGPVMAVETSAAGTGSDGAGEEKADLKSPNRKIIYTGNISLQTLEYEESAKSIHEKISGYGGFIENEDSSNEDPYWYYSDRSSGSAANRTRRSMNITARVPAEKFDSFMKDLEEDGQVTNSSISARNISEQYASHDASRKALEIEQKRLLEMMDRAETVDDMIAVEKRLTQVERELGSEKTQLSAMDRDVDFSTVYISLQEVFEYSETVVEVTYGERLRRAFGRAVSGFVTFWQELLLAVVEAFPFLLMLAAVIIAAVKLIRAASRRRRQKLLKMEEERRRRMTAGSMPQPGAPQGAGRGAAADVPQGAGPSPAGTVPQGMEPGAAANASRPAASQAMAPRGNVPADGMPQAPDRRTAEDPARQ